MDPSDEPETPAPMPEDLWAEYQEAEARFEADDDVTTEDLENLIVSYLETYGPTGTDLAEVIDPLVVLPGSRPGDPRIADYQVVLPPWADYPYFTTGQRTAVMPDENADFLNPSAHATYNGAVRGVLADGEALSGTSFFDIGFNPGGAELDGHFNFVTGETVTFSGTQDGDLLYFNIDSGGFRDGTIAHGNGSGGFYGPAAQEFAGDWAFTVVDGTDPGLASGQFAAKR